jgi:hypothetical protein
MSNYGPSGGPYRDHPQDPYEPPSDPWSAQDPWGGAPASTPPGAPGSPTPGYGVDQPGYGYGGDPGYGQQPGYGQPDPGYGYGADPTYQQSGGYPPADPGYGQPAGPPDGPPPVWSTPAPAAPPPPRRRGLSTGVVVLLTVLAVLAVGGVGLAAWKLGDDGRKDDARANPSTTTAPPTEDPVPSAEGPGATGSPPAARFAKKGQCLINKGTSKRPEIQLAECGKNTFQVLARFDGTADYASRCGKVKGYTDHYFYNSEVDSLDFVLCLKRIR